MAERTEPRETPPLTDLGEKTVTVYYSNNIMVKMEPRYEAAERRIEDIKGEFRNKSFLPHSIKSF